jgi:hypothetical protein
MALMPLAQLEDLLLSPAPVTFEASDVTSKVFYAQLFLYGINQIEPKRFLDKALRTSHTFFTLSLQVVILAKRSREKLATFDSIDRPAQRMPHRSMIISGAHQNTMKCFESSH